MTRNSLRVLMISDVYFPRINGVSTSIETFRHDLRRHGVDVTLVAPEYPQRHDAPATHRVPSRRLPFDPEDRLMHWGKLRRTTQQLAGEEFDIVHIQTPFSAHYAGVRAARQMGVPAVATYHTHFEEYFHHYLPALPRAWLRATARHIARGQCNQLDAVVVPSQAMRTTLADYGVSVPLHVLSTGIPVEKFQHGDGARFRRAHGIARDRCVALFVGRVAHEKNIGFLLDAMVHLRRRLPSALLVVAGEGPALPALTRSAYVLGLEGHVRFVGYLDRATELPDCYAAADVFAFASKTETQGLVLLEAMAAGLPAYALAEMGTRDILEPRRGAVVAPDDPAEFAAGLASLLADQPRRERLAAEARDYAGEWSGPERARQLAELYRSLV
ncbi:MAG: glycosyltransferase [Rhodocyclaceae bacterium]|nr:glycosyltransferase [Rhodocyclaceae bacterium]